jgi:hypothetical protein
MIDSEIVYEKKIIIYNEETQFIIQKGEEIISIQKTDELTVAKEKKSKISQGTKVLSIAGVIDTRTNKYLLAVNRATFVGNLLNHPIFKIDEVIIYLIN